MTIWSGTYLQTERHLWHKITIWLATPINRGFLEYWNSQKSVSNIWQRYSCLLDERITKIWKKFSQWFLGGRLRQGKNVLPDGLNWLCYFAGNSKSQRENSISFIFLESTHQVDMKNVAKTFKHIFGYFNALETHSEIFHLRELDFLQMQ